MTHKFTHEIVCINRRTGKEIMLLKRNYNSYLFNEYAFRWFDKEVLHRFPDADKTEDTTILPGYHFEVGMLVFELR